VNQSRNNVLRLIVLTICALWYVSGVLDEPLFLREPGFPRREASVVAAGDVAGCWWRGDEATARLLDRIGGTVLALGDDAYPSGSAGAYAHCYAPTWGRHLKRTRPVPGDQDLRTDSGAPYYHYFGARAGASGRGYYSFDLAGWHMIALNSAADVGQGSAQIHWLRADLAAHPARCTLAYWHHPRFSSGRHGSQEKMKVAWQILYDAGAEIVLSGHDHHYERFAPMTAEGDLDRARGIRQFVAGTAGAPLYRPGKRVPNSEAQESTVHGVLELNLRPGSYDWRFVPVTGSSFRDTGRASCH
jgi:hypothetical protein